MPKPSIKTSSYNIRKSAESEIKLKKEQLDRKLRAMSQNNHFGGRHGKSKPGGVIHTESVVHSDEDLTAKEGGSSENDDKKEEKKVVETVTSSASRPPIRRRVVLPGNIHDLNPIRNEPTPRNDTNTTCETTASSKSRQEQEKPLTDYQLKEFARKRFEREKQGKFELIFPFNGVSEDLSSVINRQSTGNGSISVAGPSNANHMKQLVQEIKSYYEERNAYFGISSKKY